MLRLVKRGTVRERQGSRPGGRGGGDGLLFPQGERTGREETVDDRNWRRWLEKWVETGRRGEK